MFVVLWRFTTRDPAAFERHYGPQGTWELLFRKSAEYVRTDLLRDGETYVTLDWWTSLAAYDAFRENQADEYARIDALCEEITTSEEKLGEFERLD